MDTASDILNSNLSRQVSSLSIRDSLLLFTELYPGQVCFSTSFSVEDQVILHHIATENLPIQIFTLDTGQAIRRNLFGMDSHQGKIWHRHTGLSSRYNPPGDFY